VTTLTPPIHPAKKDRGGEFRSEKWRMKNNAISKNQAEWNFVCIKFKGNVSAFSRMHSSYLSSDKMKERKKRKLTVYKRIIYILH